MKNKKERLENSKKAVLWILLPLTLGTKTELNYIEYRVRTCYIITAKMTLTCNRDHEMVIEDVTFK